MVNSRYTTFALDFFEKIKNNSKSKIKSDGIFGRFDEHFRQIAEKFFFFRHFAGVGHE